MSEIYGRRNLVEEDIRCTQTKDIRKCIDYSEAETIAQMIVSSAGIINVGIH